MMRWKNECIVNCDVNDDGLECYDRIIENNEDGDDDAHWYDDVDGTTPMVNSRGDPTPDDTDHPHANKAETDLRMINTSSTLRMINIASTLKIVNSSFAE